MIERIKSLRRQGFAIIELSIMFGIQEWAVRAITKER